MSDKIVATSYMDGSWVLATVRTSFEDEALYAIIIRWLDWCWKPSTTGPIPRKAEAGLGHCHVYTNDQAARSGQHEAGWRV